MILGEQLSQLVFGNREVDFVEPTFAFNLSTAHEKLLIADFVPPVHRAESPQLFHLTLQSDVGGNGISLFQIKDVCDVGLSQAVGGVVIQIAGQEKLIIVSSEQRVWGLSTYRGIVPILTLLKVNSDDQTILIKPALQTKTQKPYVLENYYTTPVGYTRRGLRLLKNSLVINNQNGITYVERVQVK